MKTQVLYSLVIASIVTLFAFTGCKGPQNGIGRNIDSYNITWNSSSTNSAGSMPVGGGDIGCNVWVENGDIMAYAQRSGGFDATGEYLKLGRFRIRLDPNPLTTPVTFCQKLILKDGYAEIEAVASEVRPFKVRVRIWTDMFTHSLHFRIESEKEINVTAFYESWRTTDKELTDDNRGRFGCFGLEGYPGKVIKKKDSIGYYNHNSVLFCHHNDEHAQSVDVMIEQQGLEQFRDSITNNLSSLAMGGIMFGNNYRKGQVSEGIYLGTPYKSWSIESTKPAKHHQIIIATHIAQEKDINRWKEVLLAQARKSQSGKGYPEKNVRWWNDFWSRSWIVVDPLRVSGDTVAWNMGRNYQLMRYQLGCNLYGEYPSKFNGGNFTFDPVAVGSECKHDPDWRQWGGDVFTAQNQRLLYWPMLKSGDFDGLDSQFKLYERGLNGAKAKVKRSFGHEGAIFSEYANAPGLDIASGWGWNGGTNHRQRGEEIPFGDPRADATHNYNSVVEHGVMANQSISYHWESQVEHAYMMLELHRFTGINIDRYMPFIHSSLEFFDKHYRKRQFMRSGKELDEDGKLLIYPSTSCESYRGSTNPSDLIAGIRACLKYLIKMDGKVISDQKKSYYTEYLHRLPELNFGKANNGDIIALPARSWIRYQNVECPQFYPLFPFDRYDLTNTDTIQIYRNTWKHGTFPKNMTISWHQDGIFYARMGMVNEAFEYNKKKLANSKFRFPTFWGPGHDWVPDHNQGGSGMIGLQEMLLQTIGDKIHVLPAWPKEMDVDFKLHAPGNTTIEVIYRNGKVEKLEVSPKSMIKNVRLFH